MTMAAIDWPEDEREEVTECEKCAGPTMRVCSRCGRRICRACATDHPTTIIELWMVDLTPEQLERVAPKCTRAWVRRGRKRESDL